MLNSNFAPSLLGPNTLKPFFRRKSANPFAYYTATITNSFTRVLNMEKKNQNLRDDLLQEAGVMPSLTRQMQNEDQQKDPTKK